MTQFHSFVRKEYLHILRDWRTMLILLAMPVVMILLFGFAITTEVRNANVAYILPNHTPLTDRLLQRIDASPYFTLTHELHNQQEAHHAFRQGQVALVITFNHDNTALQLLADGSEPNQANLVVNYAKGIIATHLAATATQPLAITTRMLYNPQQLSAYNFVPGVMGLILMLICAMMTSIAIVREKETGTMEVLLASPLHPATIILAKLVPYFTLSLLNITTILLLALHVLHLPIRGSLILLLTLCLLFSLLALTLGLLISTLTSRQMTAMLASGLLLLMPVMLLSGMMFPIESMPRILQYLSAIVPARWFIQALKKVMLQGCALHDIATELTILATITLFLIVVSWRNFKTRLQ